MTVSLKHNKVVVTADDGTSEVGSNEWNEEHNLTLATGKVLGRASAGTGAAEELSFYTVSAPTVASKTANYTPALGDERTYFFMDTTSGNLTFTIPPNSSQAFAIGTQFWVEWAGSNTLTVSPGSGVTLRTNLSNGPSAAKGVCFYTKIDTDKWTVTSVSNCLVNWTEAVSTATPNATVPVVSITALNSATDVDAAPGVPKGAGAFLAQVPNNATSGGNKRGANAVDLQTIRTVAGRVASGQESVVVGGKNNSATQVNAAVVGGIGNQATGTGAFIGGGGYNGSGSTAAGTNAVVAGGDANTGSGTHAAIGGGSGNTASGQYSVVPGGQSNSAGGNHSYAGGNGSTTTGTTGSAYAFAHGNSVTLTGIGAVGFGVSHTINGNYAVAFGNTCTADRDYSQAWGNNGNARSTYGMRAWGSQANQQVMELVLRKDTTNATATTLTSDGGSAGQNNQLVPGNMGTTISYTIRGQISARQTAGTGSGSCKYWKFEGMIKNIGGTLSLVGSITPTSVAADAGAAAWGVTVTADTASWNALKIEVTGEASKTIRWTCWLEFIES